MESKEKGLAFLESLPLFLFCHFINACCTHLFVFGYGKVCVATAKNTVGSVFSQNYFVSVERNFDRVVAVDIECGSHFFRHNKSAKLVNIAYDSGRFHIFPLFAEVLGLKFVL